MIVRDLRAEDHAPWLLLWQGYLEFYETNLADDVTALTFQRFLDPAEPMFALIAEQDGVLLGFAHCVLHRGTWTIGDHCYLEDLFVAPDIRGSGVGRALIEAVYARADALHCERTYWVTHATNHVAQDLYDKVAHRMGFIQYRRDDGR